MATDIKKWMPLIAIGGVLWFLSRDGFLTRASGNGVNGNGLNGYGEPGGPGGGLPAGYGGMSNVGGSIGAVDVPMDQSLGLRAHRVEKEAGDSVEVVVDWQQTTTNFQGIGIDWPASMRVELGHPTGFTFYWDMTTGGWDNMNELLGGTGGEQTTYDLSTSPGVHSWIFNLTVGPLEDPGQDWDVRATLSMQGSTDVGAPDGSWKDIVTGTHDSALKTVATTGTSAPGGTFDDIFVYQGQRKMRKLGMRQARPPWGFQQPEVRSWPRYNRNSMLPGVQIGVRQFRTNTAIGPGARINAV